MAPVVQELKKEYEGRMQVIVAETSRSDSQQLAAQFGIQYVPTFIVIDQNGNIVPWVDNQGNQMPMFVGGLTKEELKAQMDKVALTEKKTPKLNAPSQKKSFAEKLADKLPGLLGDSKILALVIVFLGGIATSFTPCILGMIPLIIGYTGGYAQRSPGKGFIYSLFFVLGLATTLTLLGIGIGVLGTFIKSRLFAFNFILGIVAILMGLAVMGLYTISLPGLKRMPVKGTGLFSSYLMGLFFGFSASPCATPVLIVIVTYALAKASPLFGGALLFSYSFGHGLPLILAGTFSAFLGKITSLGRYGEIIDYIFGGVLVLYGLYLLFGQVL